MARDIWFWAIDRGIWLSAAHVPGKDNCIADFKSRNFQDNLEWTLNPVVFSQLSTVFFEPEIDLFATRLNHHVPKYVSWKPDPHAWATDAFTISWDSLQFYAFPPFSLIGRVLAKIQQDEAQGLLVVPFWSTQPWFPQIFNLLVDHTRVLQPQRQQLILQGKVDAVHPLYGTLNLLALHLSGVRWRNSLYLRPLETSSPIPGDQGPKTNMPLPCIVGESFVFGNKLIPFLPL